jgi:hypothetical protein
VNAAQPGPVIHRNIYGQFAEHLGTGIYGGVWVGKDSSIPNVRGIRKDVVEALRAIKVAGNYGEMYDTHWGPKALDLPRGMNNLYNKGGMHYTLPLR